jgi:hypothetical protein
MLCWVLTMSWHSSVCERTGISWYNFLQYEDNFGGTKLSKQSTAWYWCEIYILWYFMSTIITHTCRMQTSLHLACTHLFNSHSWPHQWSITHMLDHNRCILLEITYPVQQVTLTCFHDITSFPHKNDHYSFKNKLFLRELNILQAVVFHRRVVQTSLFKPPFLPQNRRNLAPKQ